MNVLRLLKHAAEGIVGFLAIMLIGWIIVYGLGAIQYHSTSGDPKSFSGAESHSQKLKKFNEGAPLQTDAPPMDIALIAGDYVCTAGNKESYMRIYPDGFVVSAKNPRSSYDFDISVNVWSEVTQKTFVLSPVADFTGSKQGYGPLYESYYAKYDGGRLVSEARMARELFVRPEFIGISPHPDYGTSPKTDDKDSVDTTCEPVGKKFDALDAWKYKAIEKITNRK